MKIGTLTVNQKLSEEKIKNIKEIYNFEMLFIQYKEEPLYNMNRSTFIVGEHSLIENGQHYNILKCKDQLILQCNIQNENELWDLLEEHDFDIVLGYFLENADENIHFELTFEFKDSYKDMCHEKEVYPEFTDKINQIRDTWILTKENSTCGVFELDTFTNGMWLDVKNKTSNN